MWISTKPAPRRIFSSTVCVCEALKQRKKSGFASSGCVYPNFFCNRTPKKELYLTEDLTKGPNDADIPTAGPSDGEFTLQAYAKEHGMGAASCRYFTVYGPRGVEHHAVIAHGLRARFSAEPFRSVWATAHRSATGRTLGHRRGTIPGREKINDGTAINLGTMERIRVIDCAKMVCEFTGHKSRHQIPPGYAHRPSEPGC